MGTLVVIIVIVLILCCIFKEQLNKILEIGIALAIVGGVIYGVKTIFDLSWLSMGIGIVIFSLGSYLVNGKK